MIINPENLTMVVKSFPSFLNTSFRLESMCVGLFYSKCHDSKHVAVCYGNEQYWYEEVRALRLRDATTEKFEKNCYSVLEFRSKKKSLKILRILFEKNQEPSKFCNNFLYLCSIEIFYVNVRELGQFFII